jgi:hypothetical protein
MYDNLLHLLLALDGVAQHPKYHPEGDALFHSLQVFEHALKADPTPTLLAAALLHDVGKAHGSRDHAELGAVLLDGLPDPVRWLVAHHLDLLRHSRRTRTRLGGTTLLRDLQLLRRWDVAGRDPRAWVREPEEAVAIVVEALAQDRSMSVGR